MEATVIIYTYDRRDYILKAIESAVDQTLPRKEYEIIVVKGFVDTEIDKIIKEKSDKLLQINERGHGKKLAPAIKMASGKIIFILDDDDEFVQTKLERVTQLFKEQERLVFVHDSIVTIDDSGKITNSFLQQTGRERVDLDTSSFRRRDISKQLSYRSNWYSSCMAFKKSILMPHIEQIEKVEQSIDPFLYFIALDAEGILSYIPDRLTKYRVHESTTNYRLEINDFINRREKFYSNTIETYRLACSVHRNVKTSAILIAELNHISLIHTLLSSDSTRTDIVRGVMGLIKSFSIIFNSSYIIWVIFSLVRLINVRLSFSLFYRYMTKDL